MKYTYLLLLSSLFIATGCNSTNLANSIDGALARTAGNKSPVFFKVANVETMKDYIFETDNFSFKFPTAKQSDFSMMGGWEGGSMHDSKTIVTYLHPVYHIELTFDTYKYLERERATEYKDYQYLQSNYIYVKNKYGREYNINVHYETHGKEKYSCLVRESRDDKNVIKKIAYHCFKYNLNRTMAKKVLVKLTYNKPKKPTLAQEYTYQDLQNRAKRVLDSLYIKDGW